MAIGASFTIAQYKELLKKAKKSYNFINYQDIDYSKRFIIWRHDIDFSLNRALHLARVEFEEGITSTYFINLHSEFYNAMERSQSDIIVEILRLGHCLGIHLDAAYYNINNKRQIENILSFEAEILSRYFDTSIYAFSFHNPTEEILNKFVDIQFSGLINCYSSEFRSKIGYCSDSNGMWRHRNLYQVLEVAEDYCLQVLTHPGWWHESEMCPNEKIERSVTGRAEATLKLYFDTLKAHGRL